MNGAKQNRMFAIFQVMKIRLANLFVIVFLASCATEGTNISKPLASWNDGDSKNSIINFVEAAVDESHSSFIPMEERIAVFDNDGTLWAEKPFYFQLFFAIDQIKQQAADHPEWDTTMPYSAILHDDLEALLAYGEKGLVQLVMSSHAGMTQEEFRLQVIEWNKNARHPRFEKAYTEMVYQPMLELLQYLQENEFKTYIVSGGGVDFMRPLVSEIYNIPPEMIIGSTLKTEYEYNNGDPKIYRKPELLFVDDKHGKPENIQRIIGRKPVIAVGNSDGDLAMLQYTSSATNFLNIYVHHTDGQREWAYDRDSHVGRLDKGLDQAHSEGWTVVDMKKDWKVIFPFDSK
jgi:phosphoglycolate phosphatase-like HAD superfamily hydrolase